MMISNGYRKVKNPTSAADNSPDEHIYVGNIRDFTRVTPIQYNNYMKIQESLEPFGITLETIHYRGWTINSYNKTNFLVETSHPNLLWHKYESNSHGSSQNFIYYKDKKINTTRWLKYTSEQIKVILEE